MTARAERVIWSVLGVELAVVGAVAIATSDPNVTAALAYLIASLNVVVGLPLVRWAA